MTPLETYFRNLHEIHASGAGVKETSYYGTLEHLLNEIGTTLKPRVRCIITLKNQGAGLPDGGLFTANQFPKNQDLEPFVAVSPERGVIEIKGTKEEVKKIAVSEQVRRYHEHYGQVLVTNYRDFLLIGKDKNGERVELETYSLAPSEAEFWMKTANPSKFASEQGDSFLEYLKRVLLQAAPISSPVDVAWFLASYARDAKARLERQSHLPALQNIRQALENALGIKFEAERGDKFFRSTLVQTLFYGLFSAWVLWHKENPNREDAFDWRFAAHYLHVPMLAALFESIAAPTKLRSLGLIEVLEWTGSALNRVRREDFFRQFEEGQAVQYFYEPFLQAFDPDLRKELGVWYTPPEIVRYMVARVDRVLREELDIEDGLANPDVYILDPCCGTGAYLLEVLRYITEILQENGADALTMARVKKTALDRLFGFEILTAPFVVAHLQLGLFLQGLGVPLQEESERVGVYLTNALTGWEPPKEEKQLFLFPELEEEREAAEKVKREKPILVILGNPPYNGYAGIAVGEERDLSNAYRTTKNAPKPKGQGLNELYIRFFRMAERRIVEQTGQGVICYISNYSWLDGLSHPGMREKYLEVFSDIWIDCLNGDKFATGKRTPDGDPDPSVFSTEWNKEGIETGTAIALLLRKKNHRSIDCIKYRDFWGNKKRAEILGALENKLSNVYTEIKPEVILGLPFKPKNIKINYSGFPLLTELFPTSFPGVKTSRDPLVVDISQEMLVEKIEKYFNPNISHEEMAKIVPISMIDGQRYSSKKIREHLQKRGILQNNFIRYCYRPFDTRWLYWEPETKLLDEKRSDYFPHVAFDNIWLGAAQHSRREFDPPFLSSHLCSLHIIERGANFFPLKLRVSEQGNLLAQIDTRNPIIDGWQFNLSDASINYLNSIGTITDAEYLFYHTLAILYTPLYSQENSGALRLDWARIPLPNSRDSLISSARLGKQIAALLDTETPVPEITKKPKPEWQKIAVISGVGGGQLNPDAGDLLINVGWGHGGKNGVTMPGKGKAVERDYIPEEIAVISPEKRQLLGQKTLDIYINDRAYWKNIPSRVWEYTIGGYQVIKKWLSYREEKLLGRGLTLEEVREVTDMAKRIAAIILLESELDENYRSILESGTISLNSFPE